MTNRFAKISLLFLFTLILACERSESNDAPRSSVDPTLQQLNQQIQANPELPEAYLARAQYYYEKDSYEQAIVDAQGALQVDSTHLNSLHLLADVYLDYFKSKKAIETLEYASSLYPSNIQTLLKKSEFHYILKQYEASMQTINEILKQEPQNAEAFFMFGQNFMEQGDTARAINSYQTAVEYEPELIDAWIKLGQLQAAIGNSIAAKYFDSAISIDPENPIVRHAKADYYADQGKLQEAIQVYRDLALIDPNYDDAYYNSGLIYLDMDSIPQAYNQFDICIKTAPLHIRAYYYRGLTAEFLDRKEQAISDYKQALVLAPDFEDAQEGLSRVSR